MLKFTQTGPKVKIGKEYILKEYVKVASRIPSFPTFPTGGYDGEGLHGPWYAYLDVDDCYAFLQQCGSTIIFTHGDEPVTITLKVEAFNLSEGTLKEGKLTGAMARALTVHVSLRVPPGKLFKLINMQMIKQAWDQHGFLVLKANRAGVKFEGVRLREKGLEGGEYHLDIRPRTGVIFGAFFPPYITIDVLGMAQYLEYKIFHHVDLDGMLCLSHCHRYFDHVIRRERWTGTEACVGHRAPPVLHKNSKKAVEAFLQLANAHEADLASRECEHYAKGLCYGARTDKKTCRFLHTAPPDPGQVRCAHPKKRPGDVKCKFPTCAYAHGEYTDAEVLNTMEDDSANCAPPAPGMPRGRVGWNPTLGYPGEGPLRMVGLNARGLRDAFALDALLREAKRSQTDVLFLQEHNWREEQIPRLRRRVQDSYLLFACPGGSVTGRGGAAVLIRAGSSVQRATARVDHEHGDTLGGRLCAVDVKVHDFDLRLASVYVPVHDSLKSYFI